MSGQCTNCGANLQPPSANATRARCRYCQLEQDRPGARPAMVDSDPSHANGASPRVAQQPAAPEGRAGRALVLFAVLVAPLVVLSVVASRATKRVAVSFGHRGGGMSVAELTHVAIDVAPDKLEEQTHVAADRDHRMYVPLNDSRFDAVIFQWEKDRPTHVASFTFVRSTNGAADEEIRRRLQQMLGRRFRDGTTYVWGGCNLYFGADGNVFTGSASVDVGIGKNPHGARQVDALWGIARAALGLPVSVDDASRRDWLGGGYPLASLAAVDPQTDIDVSHDALETLFPGVLTVPFIDLDHTVAIDHPWYGQAKLSWKNKKGATLATVSLSPPPSLTSFESQKDIDACVERAFGKPKERTESDHLSGDFYSTWTLPGGGEIVVFKHQIMIRVSDNPFATRGPNAMPTATYQRVITALDACGKR